VAPLAGTNPGTTGIRQFGLLASIRGPAAFSTYHHVIHLDQPDEFPNFCLYYDSFYLIIQGIHIHEVKGDHSFML
jgi:hypothetical protein